MSNKDTFSFDPFARDIEDQVSTPSSNTGIMSKDMSSTSGPMGEQMDDSYDPFSFVERFAKDLVSLFDENEEDKEKLKNTYRVDKSLEKQAAKESVLDELVVDYNAAFERGRSLKESMDIVEAQPLLPIGTEGVLQSPVPVSRPSSLQVPLSGAPFVAPTPQRRPRGLMEKDDESSGYVRLPQFKNDIPEDDAPKDVPIIPELVAPAMATLYKDTPVNLRAFGEYLVKGTLASAFKAVLGSDEKVVEAPTFTERDLADSDMKNLQNIVASKGLGADGLNYKDFGYGGSDSIRDIVASASPTSTVLNSFTDSDLRMASFIGNGDIVVEDGDVFVVDTYDFEPRQKDIYKKYQEGKTLTEEEQGVIDNMSIFNRLYHLADYMGKELKSQDDNVRIRLGTVEEVYGDQENASLSFISNSQSEIDAAPASKPSGPAYVKRKRLLDFIGTGEGDYDSANRGTISGNIIGSEMTASRRGKSISEMTIGEIAELQKISDPNNEERLFAVGKYQTIPDTLAMAVKGLGLSEDTVFSPEVQDQIGVYLVTEKRPKVGMYLRGEEGVSADDAMLSLAREFASIPVPRAVKKGEFGSWPKTDLVPGDSFYANPAATTGNAARHSVEETRVILQDAQKGFSASRAAPLTSPTPARRGLMS